MSSRWPMMWAMPRSHTYHTVLDPHDPIWHGHAEVVHEPWWHNAALYWMICAATLPIIVMLAVGAAPRARPTAPAASAFATAPTAIVEAASRSADDARLPVIDPSEPVTSPRARYVTPVVMSAAAATPAPPAPPARRVRKSSDVTAARGWGRLDASYTPPPFVTQQTDWLPNFTMPGGGPSLAVTGDVIGLDPQLRAGLEQLAARMGRTLGVVSGRRTRDEQEILHARFLSGTGNLAAVPGTSRHELGQAADVYVDGVALASVPGASIVAAQLGLGFPVPGEAWHVEMLAVAAPLMAAPPAA